MHEHELKREYADVCGGYQQFRAKTSPEIRVIQSHAEIEEIANDWRDLEIRSDSGFTFFQGYEWCIRWLSQTQADLGLAKSYKAEIYTAWTNDQLVAVWPLVLYRRYLGLRMLGTLGEYHSQYSNALIDPQVDAQSVLDTMWAHICKSSSADTIELDGVPIEGDLGVFLLDRATRTGMPNATSIMDFSEFADWAGYQSSLKKSLRRGRSKRRNKLDREGKVSLQVLWPDDPGFAEAVNIAIAFKHDWIEQTGRVSKGLAWDGLGEFLAGFTGDRVAKQGLVLHALKLDDKPIAIELGFIKGAHYYCYLAGFDWGYKDLSPGKIQIESSFQWFVENGITHYDFLPNPAAYKADWTNKCAEVASFNFTLSTRGRLAVQFTGADARDRLKSVFYKLPRPARDLTKRIFMKG